MTYTVAIPTRGITTSLIRVLVEVRQNSDIDEILIGINPDSSSIESLLEPHLEDQRIRVFRHNFDLGLYGNFRFLLNQSTCD